jgi:hypothetical protein
MKRSRNAFENHRPSSLYSTVWSDALDIQNDTTRLGNFDKSFPLHDEHSSHLQYIFALLDDAITFEADYRRMRAHGYDPLLNVDKILQIADKYNLPQIPQKFFLTLWEAARRSQRKALLVFSVLWKNQQLPLAQHAMRNLADLPHPGRFS